MKRLIKILFAVILFAMVAITFTAVTSAETVPQMRLRLFADAQAKHPDVWNGCDQACVDARVASAPFLKGLAVQANVNLTDLAKYSVVRSYDWGLDFQKLYGRAPTIYDWTTAYTDTAEALRYELAASPVIFAVNRWDMPDRYYRLKLEYGGPY